jgi:hypothetical protein
MHDIIVARDRCNHDCQMGACMSRGWQSTIEDAVSIQVFGEPHPPVKEPLAGYRDRLADARLASLPVNFTSINHLPTLDG